MAFCGKCGNELREGANFCPKCGTPVGSTQVISPKKDGKSHWFAGFSLLFFTIVFMVGVVAFISNYSTISEYFSGSSETQTRQEQETTVERPSVQESAPIKEDKPSMQNDEEFKRKTMEYVGEIQQIMTTMNKIYNGYIASRNTDMMGSGRVNAQANLMDLKIKGDRIFEKMISLARQKKYQEAIDAFKQEKNDFDAQWRQMDGVLTQDMY